MKRSSTRPRPGPVACIVYTRNSAPASVTSALFAQGFTVVERQFSRLITGLLDEIEPDIVVAVIDATEADDLSVVRFLRAHRPGAPLLALCTDSTPGDEPCITAMDAGADVALAVGASAGLIGAQARSLQRRAAGGEATAGESRVLVRDLAIDFGRRNVSRRGQRLSLTRSEFDILAMLLRNAGRVVPPGEIVAGIGQFAATDAQARGMVKVHVSHLRQKLGANEDGEYVVTVRGVGYLFERMDEASDAGERRALA